MTDVFDHGKASRNVVVLNLGGGDGGGTIGVVVLVGVVDGIRSLWLSSSPTSFSSSLLLEDDDEDDEEDEEDIDDDIDDDVRAVVAVL